jgi:hypothetical protein
VTVVDREEDPAEEAEARVTNERQFALRRSVFRNKTASSCGKSAIPSPECSQSHLDWSETELKMNDSKDVSRRAALMRTALAVATAASAVVTRASAQQKVTQATVQYQNKPKGPQNCAVCVNFQPPNACKFVQGTISPNGWCMLFSAQT